MRFEHCEVEFLGNKIGTPFPLQHPHAYIISSWRHYADNKNVAEETISAVFQKYE